MTASALHIKPTTREYLAGEHDGETRHEFINGDIYAMGGASEAHNLISLNIAALLRGHLRGSPCRVFINDMKIRILRADDERYYYPDIQVTCAAGDAGEYFKEQPLLVVEVLSPSTERADRTEKFEAYRALPSLEEYVLVAQDKKQVEIYRRGRQWEAEIFLDEASLRFEAVDLSLDLAALYEDVRF